MNEHTRLKFSTHAQIAKILTVALLSVFFVVPIAPAAHSAPFNTPYDSGTGAGDVYCTTSGSNTGFFTISNYAVISNTNCAGHVEVPEGVAVIWERAFQGASQITSVFISKTVTSLGYQSFTGASNLYTVTFDPDSVLSSIGYQAFYSTKIRVITFPRTLTSISDRLFVGTPIESVTFLGDMPIVGGNFHNISGGTAYFQNADSFYARDVGGTQVPYAFGDDWYGLTLSSGAGPTAPLPTISLINTNDVITATLNFPMIEYQLQFTAANPSNFSVSLGSFPPGIDIDINTGLITGTANGTSGSYSATIRVTDQYGFAEVVVPFLIQDPFVPPISLQKVSRVYHPKNFVNVGRLTFFSGQDNEGEEWLWVTDGSETETRIIGSTSQPIYYGANSITPVSGGVVFQGEDRSNDYAPALYFSDGRSGDPVKIPTQVAPRYNYSMLTAIQNRLYYRDSTYKLVGIDLNGNSISTPDLSFPYAMTPVGNRLFYLDDESSNLMFINQGTNLIETVTVPTGSAENFPKFDFVSNLTPLNGGILFSAYDPVYFNALWYLDANSTNPVKVASGDENFQIIATGPSSSRCQESNCSFSVHDGYAYFYTGLDLWKTDGVSSTFVKEVGESYNNFRGIWYGNNFYYTFDIGDGRGVELQEYNPTSDTISGITDIKPGIQNSEISELGSTETALFFGARDSSNGIHLWISGTASEPEPEPESGPDVFNWSNYKIPGGLKFSSIASNSDGSLLLVGAEGGLFKSNNAGKTWVNVSSSLPSETWTVVTSSGDGLKLAAGAENGNIWTSSNGGETWQEQEGSTDFAGLNDHNWIGLKSSLDGSRLTALLQDGLVIKSEDFGINWIDLSPPDNYQGILSLAMVEDGSRIFLGTFTNKILIWDGDNGWSERDSVLNQIAGFATNRDGTVILAGNGGGIAKSENLGGTWNYSGTTEADYMALTVSVDGTNMAATFRYNYPRQIVTSSDSGVTWSYERIKSTDGFNAMAANQSGKLLATGSGSSVWVGTPASHNATLSGGLIKGLQVTNLGIPARSINNTQAGLHKLPFTAAQNESAQTSFSPTTLSEVRFYDTSVFSNASVSQVSRVVKYSSGSSTSNFDSDAVYETATVSNGDFFIVQVTAADSTKLYYRINVEVAPQAIIRPTSGTTYRAELGSTVTINPELAYATAGSFSITGGALPTGLSISDVTTGSISGSPSELGNFEATLKWTGSDTGTAETKIKFIITSVGAIPAGLRMITSGSKIGGLNSFGAMTTFNNRVYFANDKGYEVGGSQLWSTDGTEAGTSAFFEVFTDSQVDLFPFNIMRYRNGFVFRGQKPIENVAPHTLYFSDGTKLGTVATEIYKSIDPTGNVNMQSIRSANNLIYFTTSSQDIYSTDGTETNTVKIFDNPDHFPVSNNFTVLGGKIYYTRCSDGPPCNLWLIDTSQNSQNPVPTQLTGIDSTSRSVYNSSGYEISNVDNLTILGDYLLFNGVANPIGNQYNNFNGIWRAGDYASENILLTSGSSDASTFNNGGTSSCYGDRGAICDNQNKFTVWNDFAFANDASGYLWKTDGTPSGTLKVAATGPQQGGPGIIGDVLENILYFAFNLHDGSESQVWSLDLSNESAAPVEITNILGLNPDNFTTLNGSLLFTGADATIWSYTPPVVVPPAPPASSTSAASPVTRVQQSNTSIVVPTVIGEMNSTLISIAGKFPERIETIQINGQPIAAGSWTQTASTVTFTFPASAIGRYSVQISNGVSPALEEFVITVVSKAKPEAPVAVVKPKPTQSPAPVPTPTKTPTSPVTKPLKEKLILRTYFDLSSSVVKVSELRKLQVLAKSIAGMGKSITVTITGYAQPTPGTEAFDQALSKRRAAAVAKVLRSLGVTTNVKYLGAGRAKVNVASSRYVEIVASNN